MMRRILVFVMCGVISLTVSSVAKAGFQLLLGQENLPGPVLPDPFLELPAGDDLHLFAFRSTRAISTLNVIMRSDVPHLAGSEWLISDQPGSKWASFFPLPSHLFLRDHINSTEWLLSAEFDTPLPAGDYPFAWLVFDLIHGFTDVMASGTFDDGTPFGDSGSVLPEPSTFVLWSLILGTCGTYGWWRRRNKVA